ncbi:UNVERIFIED_ORG: hypothetical protein GGE63_003801 [Rhizobium esperanzae]
MTFAMHLAKHVDETVSLKGERQGANLVSPHGF